MIHGGDAADGRRMGRHECADWDRAWESDRRRRRSDELSVGHAPVPVDGGMRARDEQWEEYVPVLWAVGGAGEGDGAERRARLYEEGAET